MRKREKRSNNKQIIVRDYANNTIYIHDGDIISIIKFSEHTREPRTIINIYYPHNFISKISELIRKIDGV